MGLTSSDGKKGLFLSYKTIFSGGIILVITLLLITVIIQNMGTIAVKFLFLQCSIPVIVVITVSFVCGGISGAILRRRFFTRTK